MLKEIIIIGRGAQIINLTRPKILKRITTQKHVKFAIRRNNLAKGLKHLRNINKNIKTYLIELIKWFTKNYLIQMIGENQNSIVIFDGIRHLVINL
jgi:hypothetical protein